MCRYILVCVCSLLGLLFLSFPVLAAPTLTGSGIGQATDPSWDMPVTAKNSFTVADGSQYVVGWITITPGSELDNGVERYKFKYEITTPGASMSSAPYGPFPFYQGTARASRQVSDLFISYGSGSYELRFYITDTQGGSDTLAASLPFTLAGETTTVTTTEAPAAPTHQITATQETTTIVTTGTTTVPTGSISVSTTPAGCYLTIDGTGIGIAPLVLYRLPAGKHTILTHMKGYTDNTTTVTIAADKDTPLNIDLTSPVRTRPATVATTETVVTAEQRAAAFDQTSDAVIVRIHPRNLEDVRKYYSNSPFYVYPYIHNIPDNSDDPKGLMNLQFTITFDPRELVWRGKGGEGFSRGAWTPLGEEDTATLVSRTPTAETWLVTFNETKYTMHFSGGENSGIPFVAVNGAEGTSTDITCTFVSAYDRNRNPRTGTCTGSTLTFLKPKQSPEPAAMILACIMGMGLFAWFRKK